MLTVDDVLGNNRKNIFHDSEMIFIVSFIWNRVVLK
jgi:hypothetical protein